MLRNSFAIALIVLLSFSHCLNAKTLKLTYHVFHDDSPYGIGYLWVSSNATRFDFKIDAQHDMSEVVLFDPKKSILYKHDLKQRYILNDAGVKHRVKKQMNWNKSDDELADFLLQMEKQSGYPRYLNFKTEGSTFIAEQDGESLYIVKPISANDYALTPEEIALIKEAVVERRKIALAKMGLIDFLPLDIMYMLSDKRQMIFSQYINNMYALTFKLTSVERIPNEQFLKNLPNNYQTVEK